MSDRKHNNRDKPGPEPEHLNIEGMGWEEAVDKALKKKRPAEGWPDHEGESDQSSDEGQAQEKDQPDE
jgi:hypothetical protein